MLAPGDARQHRHAESTTVSGVHVQVLSAKRTRQQLEPTAEAQVALSDQTKKHEE